MATSASKRAQQQKAGIPAKRRGQQMGFAGSTIEEVEVTRKTPSLRGRLKTTNKMFADKSSQQTSSSPASPRTNSPSAPAMNTGGHQGQTASELEFKRRLARRRLKKTGDKV